MRVEGRKIMLSWIGFSLRILKYKIKVSIYTGRYLWRYIFRNKRLAAYFNSLRDKVCFRCERKNSTLDSIWYFICPIICSIRNRKVALYNFSTFLNCELLTERSSRYFQNSILMIRTEVGRNRTFLFALLTARSITKAA